MESEKLKGEFQKVLPVINAEGSDSAMLDNALESKTEVKIVSQQAGTIRDAILSKVDRGVTMIHGEGGYLRQKTEIILSVVSNHELPKIEQLARGIDPDCFMIVTRVTEVWGRGFTYSKHYAQKTEE